MKETRVAVGSGRPVDLPGAAQVELDGGVALLHPEEAIFEAMLRGWRNQQLARLLRPHTVEMRESLVRRFQRFTNDYPWNWTPADAEEWFAQAAAARRAHSTLRNYQRYLHLFLAFVTDQRYGWVQLCLERFGTHPVQVCHEWNTAAHLAEYEGRPGNRPFTRDELQAFLDFADARVAEVRQRRRKGWLAAFRDATLFKVIYAWGLRRNEAAMLDMHDFGRNPKVAEFGGYGVLHVRHGKALAGSPPRRRSVLTTMPWSVEVIAEYVSEVRPRFEVSAQLALWPTERGARVSARYVDLRFAQYRDELGLPGELTPHCLRHAYVTHLVEDGFDPTFVQQQVGHGFLSTTALYTSVGADAKNRMLRAALDRIYGPPGQGDRP
jgi:integrase/recombinase XerC